MPGFFGVVGGSGFFFVVVLVCVLFWLSLIGGNVFLFLKKGGKIVLRVSLRYTHVGYDSVGSAVM